MNVKKLPCKCKNDYQDKIHGKGIRVHNKTAKTGNCKAGSFLYRCAVCAATQSN